MAYLAVGNLASTTGLIRRGNSNPCTGGWLVLTDQSAGIGVSVLTALILASQPILLLLAVPIIMLLHRATLTGHLADAAIRDPKTGLLNSAGWHAIAVTALAQRPRAHDGGRLVGLIVIDVDHFKQINDAHGHLTGDTVLYTIAAAINGSVRTGDSVARFGGDEFVVLLPEITHTELTSVAHRIRLAISALRIPIDHNTACRVTASLGTATTQQAHPDPEDALAQLLHDADQAAYQSKRAGRNTIRKSRSTAPPGPV